MKPYRTGTIQRVRAAARKLGTFSPTDIVYELDVELPREKSVRNTVRSLYERGEIERISKGVYRYVDGKAPVPHVRKRIFRAMYVRRKFCAKDIKILTDADKSYIQALIRRLVKRGILERIGESAEGKVVVRILHADQFYLEFVKEGDFGHAGS